MSSISRDTALPTPLARRLFWRIVPPLFAIYVLNYIDRTNVGFAALQMNGELGFGPQVYGIGGGIFFAAYLVAEIPANLIVLRIGARRALAIMMLAWGLAAGSMALVQGEASFYLVRGLLGIAEAGCVPGLILYISQWFPQSARGRTMGAVSTATVLSFVVGGPLSGALLELPPWLGLAPWQWLFILEALPTVILAVFMLRYLPDRLEQARWLGESDRQLLAAALAADSASDGKRRLSDAWQAARNWRLWAFFVIYLCDGLGFLAMILWLPQIIHRLEALSPLWIGLLTAIPFLLSALAMVGGGWHSDRTGKRHRYVILGGLLGAAGFAASALLTAWPPAAIAALTFGMLCLNIILGPFWSLLTGFLTGPAAAVGIAVVSAGGSIGGFLGSVMVGRLREQSGDFASGLLAITGFLVVGALVTLLLAWTSRRGPHGAEGAKSMEPVLGGGA